MAHRKSTYSLLISLINGMFVVLLLSTMVAPFRALAAPLQQTGISMRARPAFKGNYKYGEWLTVWVELENEGSDLQAEIQVRVPGSQASMLFSRPIELPNTSRKRVPVFVLANNFSRELEVQLVAQDQFIANQKVSVSPKPNVSYFVGIVAPELGALFSLNGVEFPGIERPKTILEVQLSELPERFEPLRSFDCLIINNIDTSSLTIEQGRALENWVRQGGRLVIGGGSGSQQTTAGLPTSLLPIIPQNSEILTDVSNLQKFAASKAADQSAVSSISSSGPFVVTTGKPVSGRVLVSQGDIPLVLEQSLGSGYIDFVALDLNAPPFNSWSGTADFWSALLGPTAVYPDWMPQDISIRQQIASQMPYTLSNLPMLDLPSTKGLALLLGFYIMLVGPANYLLLRWKKRLHWAWVSIPVITIIFSVGAFSLGYALHGTDVFLNKIAIFDLGQNGSASVNTYVGLFSPAQSDYKAEVDGGGLISPLGMYYDPWSSVATTGMSSGHQVVLQQGDSASIQGLSIGQWSLQGFMVESQLVDFGQILINLQMENQYLVGTIQNTSKYNLQEAAIIINKGFYKLGNLPSGGQIEVQADLTNFIPPIFGAPLSYRLFEEQFSQTGPQVARDAEVKRMIVEMTLERGAIYKSSFNPGLASSLAQVQSPLFLAWLDDAPPSVRVSGEEPAQQTTALLLAPFSYQFPKLGQIELPSGILPGTLSQLPIDGSICGEPGSTAVYLSRGEAIFDFIIPVEGQRIHVDNLRLSLANDSGLSTSPTVSVYDWFLDEWRPLAGLVIGENLIPEAGNLVSKSGLIRLSLSGVAGGQGCYFLGLGLDGFVQ